MDLCGAGVGLWSRRKNTAWTASATGAKIGRMRRHAGEILLRQIRAEKFGECGQVSSLLVIFIARSIRLVECAPRLFASLLQIRIQLAAGLFGFDLRLAKGLLRIAFQLFRRLARLGTSVFLVTLRAGRESKCEKEQHREFHQCGDSKSKANR
jgi:hypothetical protein